MSAASVFRLALASALVAPASSVALPSRHRFHLAQPAAPGAGVPHGVCGEEAPAGTAPFSPTDQSLLGHKVPDWFNKAKLGIFVHWGLYSVPGFAPTGRSFSNITSRKEDPIEFAKHNPYAEWYFNTMQFPDSPTAKYHRTHYGEEPSEESYLRNFVPEFNAESQKWQPQEWASLFQESGAKYVVLTTKHHDSFCLWPSQVQNPNRHPSHQHAGRDIVGELTTAVREANLEMGLYYSGGFDWSFSKASGPRDPRWWELMNNESYINFAQSQLEELIAKYKPAVLWDDIAWPGSDNRDWLFETFADYFNKQCPQGLVNNRWNTMREYTGDIGTPEYSSFGGVQEKPFEVCRGIGESFGYNRVESEAQYMTPAGAVKLLVNTVALGGNLLLDVGPKADGSLPALQALVLKEMGAWMRTNREAIYGTRPFGSPGLKLEDPRFRYTQTDSHVYAILLEPGRELDTSEGSGVPMHCGSAGGEAQWLCGETSAIMLTREGSAKVSVEEGKIEVKRDYGTLPLPREMPIVFRFLKH